MQKIAYWSNITFFQDIRGRYPPQGIKQLLQWPPIQIQMFPEQKSIWILVISLPYLEALKLFNLYLVLCVWLVDHLQENMCKFLKLFTNAQIHKFANSQVREFTSLQFHKFTNSQIHEFTSSGVYNFTSSWESDGVTDGVWCFFGSDWHCHWTLSKHVKKTFIIINHWIIWKEPSNFFWIY